MNIIHLSSSILLIQNIVVKAILLYVTYVTIISLESQSYSSLSLSHSLRLSSSSSSAAAAAASTTAPASSSSSSSSSVNLFYQTKDWTIKFFDHIKNDNHVIYEEQNMNEQLEKRAINDLGKLIHSVIQLKLISEGVFMNYIVILIVEIMIQLNLMGRDRDCELPLTSPLLIKININSLVINFMRYFLEFK
ncbi:unnamed protein product [Schistosoma margrebowiei]|uniref:Uncharacterized protein n=1 Tax=Schistosoma margrebowiei TaxID=48269 RepID=A0A183M146_9TREM|nr:unnamed protein product [Schistosoma margrebowiei]